MNRYSAVRVTEVNHLGVPVQCEPGSAPCGPGAVIRIGSVTGTGPADLTAHRHEPFARYIPADDPGYMAVTVIYSGSRGAIESVQILRYTGDGEIDHSVPEVWIQRHSPRHRLVLETWGWEMGGAYTAHGDPQWLRERYPTQPSQ